MVFFRFQYELPLSQDSKHIEAKKKLNVYSNSSILFENHCENFYKYNENAHFLYFLFLFLQINEVLFPIILALIQVYCK